MGLAKLMQKEGLLPDTSLIFHMTKDEIWEVIKNRNSNIISKAIRRQKLHQEWDCKKFPDLVFGVPHPISDEQITDDSPSSKILVKGCTVYGGKVRGRACVINNLSDANQIVKGDILITYCTDIAWTPYFPLLNGLVTELGGLISHAAVVSREFNLPCIVGAKGATLAVQTGRKIQLDASEGLLSSVD